MPAVGRGSIPRRGFFVCECFLTRLSSAGAQALRERRQRRATPLLVIFARKAAHAAFGVTCRRAGRCHCHLRVAAPPSPLSVVGFPRPRHSGLPRRCDCDSLSSTYTKVLCEDARRFCEYHSDTHLRLLGSTPCMSCLYASNSAPISARRRVRFGQGRLQPEQSQRTSNLL